MKLLDRFSLVKINFASSILAALVILMLAAITISAELIERRNAQNDLRLLEALKALDNVAHQHAVERGLTAGFLGNPSEAHLHAGRSTMLPVQRYGVTSRRWS